VTLAIFVAAVVCILSCGVAAGAAIAARRRLRKRHAAREVAVRTALYRTLDEAGEPGRIVDELVAADRKLLEAKARALLPALRGEDRETLAQLLESRGVTDAARRQCRSWRATKRASAVQELGEVGSSFAVLDVAALLDDPKPVVRMAAARALGRLGHATGVGPLMGAVEQANRLPVDVAADAIGHIRDWPVSLLQPCLTDPSESTRALAVELLGRLRSLDSVEALLERLEGDPAPGVRVRAARALGRIGSSRAIAPLIDCMHSGPEALRVEAASSLGRLGTPAAIPTLRATLLGPSPRLSEASAAALSAIVPRGIDVLEEIADDPSHPAGSTARRALAARQALASGVIPAPSTLAG